MKRASVRKKKVAPGDLVFLVDDSLDPVHLYRELDDNVWFEDPREGNQVTGRLSPATTAIVLEVQEWKSPESGCRMGNGVRVLSPTGVGWIPEELICKIK